MARIETILKVKQKSYNEILFTVKCPVIATLTEKKPVRVVIRSSI